MRILQVLPALDAGGVERGTVEMALAVTACGGDAVVASAGGRMVAGVERVGGRHVTMPLLTRDPVNVLVNAARLHRLICREGIELVHARSRAPAWSAWLAARRARVPLVTTWHGVHAETIPGKRLYNSVLARGDRVIAISHYIARRIASGYGVTPPRLRIIPRGVDPVVFDPARVTGERVHRLAQAWRLPTGARIVMLPARLTRWKGGALLLEACAALAAARGGEELFCVLVGGGERSDRFARALEADAARYRFAGLRLAGHCDDMPAALSLADVVVSASLQPEPFGRAVIEAQAMGRPVVAFDHGGTAETVMDGVTGVLVPPGDGAALGAAIARTLDLPEEARQALGERARASVLSGYTTAAMQAATLDIYRELLGGEQLGRELLGRERRGAAPA